MPDSAAQSLIAEKAAEETNTTPTDDESMAELRSLLLGPAEKQIAEIHERLSDPHRQLHEVAQVLPAAVSIRTQQDNQLTEALSPAVAVALDRSVRKNPQPLVDALFPLMGPAIRKAIAAALSGMVQSLNQSLTYSFSWQGLRWRFEAWRTGKTFAEVVMLHTLLYRVEQVFLIHRQTGLLLQHLVAGTETTQDADMVSGMLTAIQDFAHDSFRMEQGEQLETMQIGELSIWIEQGPYAILAAVIRGNAPLELRETFQRALEQIHHQYGRALKEFSGDASPFLPARLLLDPCLELQFAENREASQAKRRVKPVTGITGVLVLLVLIGGFFLIRSLWRWDNYLAALKKEPGIVVTDSAISLRGYSVSGLRDPLARDPQAMVPESGLNPAKVNGHWQAFQALTPEFILLRARQLLNPPKTVKLDLKDGVLNVAGFAPHQWIAETRQSFRFVPGLSSLNENNFLDLGRIENPLIFFELDQTQLAPGQENKIDLLVADIKRLREIVVAEHKRVRLEITGHTDNSGTEERNTPLSEGRAEMVAAILNERIPSTPDLVIVAGGTKEKLRDELTESDRATNRSVTLKVVVSDAQ